MEEGKSCAQLWQLVCRVTWAAIAPRLTDLRQPLAFPARFQTKLNRSLQKKKRKLKKKKKKVPGGWLHLQIRNFMKNKLGSHACRRNQYCLLSRMPFPTHSDYLHVKKVCIFSNIIPSIKSVIIHKCLYHSFAFLKIHIYFSVSQSPCDKRCWNEYLRTASFMILHI